jgi:hypothetical protein
VSVSKECKFPVHNFFEAETGMEWAIYPSGARR